MLERDLELLCENLFNGTPNHVLLYGESEHTRSVLKGVYKRAKNKEEFLCSWHDASAITHPMDFFEPILRLKYGHEYESLREKSLFKDYLETNDQVGVFQLAKLCGREENSKNPNERRSPIFFIDGVEELFFKMDYSHLDEEDRKIVTGDFKRLHPRGFGNCLRGYLHQTGKGIFYGTVRDTEGIQFKATLGNYHYAFYNGNFGYYNVREHQGLKTPF